MNTWKDRNPDFQYIFWNEDTLRGMTFRCQERIEQIEEIVGKVDIMRWEILYKYGGVFVDADSICIEPLDATIMEHPCFAGWENERARPGLIATGTMGFSVGHPLIKGAIEWILKNNVSRAATGKMAWKNVGPGLLTRMYHSGLFNDLHVFPSFMFLPVHHTGLEYDGHRKVYAFQAWGSTHQSYDSMNDIVLPAPPIRAVSVLISSYNTRREYIQACLDSILQQSGNFHMEIVWVNDGSDTEHTQQLQECLKSFRHGSRFISVVYSENERNIGIAASLNRGLELCTSEIIIKMDSDDIMVPDRIRKQLEFMDAHPDIMICGGQIAMFRNDIRNHHTTRHPTITWDCYRKIKSHWIANHPTLCYRKSAITAIGNYNNMLMVHDLDMEIRMLKRFGILHNLEDVLVYYRLHDEQITHNGGPEGKQFRDKMIDSLLDESQ